MVVFDRRGGLTHGDLKAIGGSAAASKGSASPARRRSSTRSPPRPQAAGASAPIAHGVGPISRDREAALLVLALNAADRGAIRAASRRSRNYLAAHAIPGLHAYVTGPAGIAADLDQVADEAGRTLLIATLGLVLVLLLLVYRAPLLALRHCWRSAPPTRSRSASPTW